MELSLTFIILAIVGIVILNSVQFMVLLYINGKIAGKQMRAGTVLGPDSDNKLVDLVNTEGPLLRYKLGKTKKYIYFPYIKAKDIDEFMQSYHAVLHMIGDIGAEEINSGNITNDTAILTLRNRNVINAILRFTHRWSLSQENPYKVTKKDILNLHPIEFLTIMEKFNKINIKGVKKKAEQMSAPKNQPTTPTLDTFIKSSQKATTADGRTIVKCQSPESSSSSKEKPKPSTTPRSKSAKGKKQSVSKVRKIPGK